MTGVSLNHRRWESVARGRSSCNHTGWSAAACTTCCNVCYWINVLCTFCALVLKMHIGLTASPISSPHVIFCLCSYTWFALTPCRIWLRLWPQTNLISPQINKVLLYYINRGVDTVIGSKWMAGCRIMTTRGCYRVKLLNDLRQNGFFHGSTHHCTYFYVWALEINYPFGKITDCNER